MGLTKARGLFHWIFVSFVQAKKASETLAKGLE